MRVPTSLSLVPLPFAVLLCSAHAVEVLKQAPAEGSIAAGQVVYVDDGTCAAGQVKEITGGDRARGVLRRTRCVSSDGLKPATPASVAAPAAGAVPAPPSNVAKSASAVPAPHATVPITTAAGGPTIDLVNMGGNDCPPCRIWRALELPKLQARPEFQGVRYSYVTKVITATVPPESAFPPEIRHLQPALLKASNGWTGSPQQAIVVDGKVVDYWYGTHAGDTEGLVAMFRAIREGKPLPRAACSELDTRTTCKVPFK